MKLPKFASVRDFLLLIVGMAGTIHEAFFQVGERKVLLAVFAAMMGLSGALRLDTIRKEAEKFAGRRTARPSRKR